MAACIDMNEPAQNVDDVDELVSDEESEDPEYIITKLDRPYAILRKLSILFGCTLTLNENKLVISKLSPGINIDDVITKLHSIFLNYDHFLCSIRDELDTHIHIFIDISNIMSSCQLVKDKDGKLYRDSNIRLNYEYLNEIICGFRNVKSKFAYGSTKKNILKNIYSKWKDLGYNVRLEERQYNTDDTHKSNNEMFVDSALVAEIQNVILRLQSLKYTITRKIVICTGDGNLNNKQANFRDAVRNSLNCGWHVELWAWNITCSDWYKKLANYAEIIRNKMKDPKYIDIPNKTYMGVLSKYIPNFEIKFFDKYRNKITYTKFSAEE
jgi:hypothetical protein